MNLITFEAVVCESASSFLLLIYYFFSLVSSPYSLPFFQFLLFYRSNFRFLKILFLWSAPAQCKSPLSKQRFRLYIVVNINFYVYRESGSVNSNANFFFLRLAENFLKSVFGWVIGQEEKLLATSSLKSRLARWQ